MEKYAIYKNENDLKLYIDKVARVFNKMEKDLGTYRLKDNNPERCLKMLKKRAQVSELVFQNLFQNMIDDNEAIGYSNLFQHIDKFLKQHQSHTITFVNDYFTKKQIEKQMRKTQSIILNQQTNGNPTILESSSDDSDSSISDSEFYKDKNILLNQLDSPLHIKKTPSFSQSTKNMNMLLQSNNNTIRLSKTRVASGGKRRIIEEKVGLKFIPNEYLPKIVNNNRQSIMNKIDLIQSSNKLNVTTQKQSVLFNGINSQSIINQSPLIKQEKEKENRENEKMYEKIKKLEIKIKVQEEQIRDMNHQYEKLFMEKGQIQRNFENVKKMNDMLINNATKQAISQNNKNNNNNNNINNNKIKTNIYLQKRNNIDSSKLPSEIQLQQEDVNQLKKLQQQNERIALEKVNYWGEQRKGLKEKMEKISNIQQSDVQKYLQSLLKDLEQQKNKLTNMENQKKLQESDDDLTDKKGYEIKKIEEPAPIKTFRNQGSDPDLKIFDLPRIVRDMTIFQRLIEEHRKEMDDKNNQVMKLTNQMESLLKILENDQQANQRLKKQLAHTNEQYEKLKITLSEYKEQLNFVKNQLGIDPELFKKDMLNQKRNKIDLSSYKNQSDVAAILQTKYEDPKNITDVKKLQEMAVNLQTENFDLRVRINELEILLKKHNIAIPMGNPKLYSQQGLLALAQEKKEQHRQEMNPYKKEKQFGQQGDHQPFDSFNKEEQLLQGKQLFANQQKAQEKMEQQKHDFHKLSNKDQQQFLKQLNTEQQQQFINSLSYEQKKQFIAQQMQNGQPSKQFLDNMMQNFDSLDPETQKIFLQNLSKEDQQKFFAKQKVFQQKQQQQIKAFQNFDNMNAEEKEKFLQSMNPEEKEQFLQQKQFFEEKKQQEQFIDNMMKNFDKLTEKEKDQFLSNMNEEQRTKFFKKKQDFEKQQKEMAKKVQNFESLSAEEQLKVLENMTPELQQQMLKENKQQFLQNIAKKFDELSPSEQMKFIANLTPQQQKEFFQEKQKLQQLNKFQQEQQQKIIKEKQQQMYQQQVEKMFIQQLQANSKQFMDKKLQTGDDYIESFENKNVNEYQLKQQMKQMKDIIKKTENINKKIEEKLNDNSKTKNNKNQKSRQIKVVGPNGEVKYVTDNSDNENPKIKKKKKLNENGEHVYVTDSDNSVKNKKNIKVKKVIDKDGNVFYVTDEEQNDEVIDFSSLNKKIEKQKKEQICQKQQIQKEQKELKEQKQKELQQLSKRLQEQLERQIRDRGNKGGYLDGAEEINQAEMEYLYNMIKQEYAMKGDQMFDNKGDHVMNMFKHIFNKPQGVPTQQEFKEFLERIQKMHQKCGNDCKHLKRFFTRLGFIRKGWWTNRTELKMNQPLLEPMKFPKIKNPNIYGSNTKDSLNNNNNNNNNNKI